MGENALPATRVTQAVGCAGHRRAPLAFVAGLVLIFCLTGCVSVARLVDDSFPPSQHVEILLSPPEGRSYVAIARLSTTMDFHSVDAAMDRLVGKGRQLGADAIVMGMITDQATSVRMPTVFPQIRVVEYSEDSKGNKAYVTTLKATAIRYTDRPGAKE